jgi:hypothetical protein
MGELEMTKTGRITRVLLVHTYLVLVPDVGLWLLVYVSFSGPPRPHIFPPRNKACLGGLREGFFFALAGLAAKTKRGFEDIRQVQGRTVLFWALSLLEG